jgi:WD40 repeat protein/beta-lactamase regulating signal transducer with metallopeptidase domain
MNVIEWLGGSLSLRLAITLLHFLWQGLGVAILAVVASRWLASLGAQVRYAIHVSALLAMAACVPVTFALVDISWTHRVLYLGEVVTDAPETAFGSEPRPDMIVGTRFPGTSRTDEIELADLDRLLELVPSAEFDEADRSDDASVDSFSAAGALRNGPQSDSRADWTFVGGYAGLRFVWSRLALLAPYLVSVYLLGAMVMLARLTVGLWGGERLRRSAVPVTDASLVAMIRHQTGRIGLRYAPAVAYCERVAVPVVVGVLRPIILLPAALVSGLSPDQLQALVLHELAHIRRHDTLVNLFQRVIESLLFFHPAVWFVSRRISRERELVADDLVLAAGWSGPQYADALVRMAELSSSLHHTSSNSPLAMAATGRQGSDFQRRVLRLLEPADAPHVRLTRSGILTVAFVAATLFAAPALVAWAFGPQVTAPASQQEVTTAEPSETARHGEQETDQPNSADKAFDQQPAEAEEDGRADRYGDPLPEAAVTRLGTVRFRSTNARSSPRVNIPLAFVPGTPLLLSQSRNGDVGLWDPVSGKMLREFTPQAGFYMHDFDVSSDGHQVATLAQRLLLDSREFDTRVQIWDRRTAQPLGELNWTEPLGQQSRVVKFSPDGSVLALGRENGHIRIVDLRSGEELLKHQAGQHSVASLAFSEDGEWLAVAGRRGVALWKWLKDEEPHQLLTGARGAISVAFSPDGKWLATGSDEQAGIRVWDVATRRLQWRIDSLSDVRYYPEQIAFSADSQMLVVPVYQRGERLELRQAATGRLIRTYESRGVPMRRAVISSDQQWIAGCDYERTLHVWRVADGELQLEKFLGHHHTVQHAAFTPDGQRLIAAPHRYDMAMWEVETTNRLWQTQRDEHALSYLTMSPDGKYSAGVSFDETVRVWALDTGREVYKLPGHGRLGSFDANVVAFTPDARQFLSFGNDMHLRIWDTNTGKGLVEYDLRPHFSLLAGVDSGDPFAPPGAVRTPTLAAISPDCQHLLVIHSETLLAFDTATGEVRNRHEIGQVEALQIDPAGTMLATKERHRTNTNGQEWTTDFKLREVESLEVTHEIKAPPSVRFMGNVQFAPQGERLAISTHQTSDDGNSPYFLHVYDKRSGKLQGKRRLPDLPTVIAFSPDGRQLAIGNGDTTIHIWDVEQLLEDEE